MIMRTAIDGTDHVVDRAINVFARLVSRCHIDLVDEVRATSKVNTVSEAITQRLTLSQLVAHWHNSQRNAEQDRADAAAEIFQPERLSNERAKNVRQKHDCKDQPENQPA